MDEFQNFRQLLHAESETGMIVEKFLKHDSTKVLLLSATPYKPYSTIEEISENNDEDHYVEFMQVMDFLFTDEDKRKKFREVWNNYSNKLIEFKNKDYTSLRICKNEAEDAMYQGVCRTERFNVNKNGIIDDSQAKEIAIEEGDIISYVKTQSLLKDIGASNIPIDYVKSCPYLLSFMNQYKQKREIVNYFNKHKDYNLLNKRKDLFLNRNQIQNYKEIPMNNARLEYLKEMLFQKGRNGLEKLLWIPSSKPYYVTNSLFDKNSNASKVLVNKPESIAAVDLFYGKRSERTYYKNVLAYLVDGNIQAVLDEYSHTLGVKAGDLLEQITEGMNLRTSTSEIDTYDSFTGQRKKSGLRAHFAVGYYNAKGDDENIQRTENIRTAFNSPFRPFVLATTSIGQEGLDFHLNCRKVVHWNLPSNPIDLEQREGRINRFKCLAIRQNIANKYGDIEFNQYIWEEMFNEASKQEKGNNSDLVPYWSLPNTDEDIIKIERIVPMYPMSKDKVKYKRLIKVLSLYRLTLGQPRQEELLNSLGKNFEQGENIEDLFINLSPFKRRMREVEF